MNDRQMKVNFIYYKNNGSTANNKIWRELNIFNFFGNP